MSPHELTALSAEELSTFFFNSLIQNQIADLRDALGEIECRFLRMSADARGSSDFLDAFMPLSGRAEVRAMHIYDPQVRSVERLEHLLDLAHQCASAKDAQAVLRQIVGSRKRGFDLVRLLADAPEEGFQIKVLSGKMKISHSNLSPLITDFHASGVIHREASGSSAYVRLTPQGRALLGAAKPAPPTVAEPRFLRAPMSMPLLEAYPPKAA